MILLPGKPVILAALAFQYVVDGARGLGVPTGWRAHPNLSPRDRSTARGIEGLISLSCRIQWMASLAMAVIRFQPGLLRNG